MSAVRYSGFLSRPVASVVNVPWFFRVAWAPMISAAVAGRPRRSCEAAFNHLGRFGLVGSVMLVAPVTFLTYSVPLSRAVSKLSRVFPLGKLVSQVFSSDVVGFRPRTRLNSLVMTLVRYSSEPRKLTLRLV